VSIIALICPVEENRQIIKQPNSIPDQEIEGERQKRKEEVEVNWLTLSP